MRLSRKAAAPSLVTFLSVLFVSCTTGHWRQLATDENTHAEPILSLFFFNQSHGLAITPTHLLETNDGGRTFEKRLSQEEGSLQSLVFVDARTGWIAGSELRDGVANPLVLNTIDGGVTWQKRSVESAGRLSALSFCTRDVGCAAGGNAIVQTSDGGGTWRQQYTGEREDHLYGIFCLSPEEIWAVGESGLVLNTRDGGTTWAQKDLGVDVTLSRIRFFGDTGWIIGFNGTLLRTRDRGTNWEAVRLNTNQPLLDIHFDGPTGWIVGGGGTILRSADAGKSWHDEPALTNNDLLTLFFIDRGHGWIGGASQTVLSRGD
jgi:photosystem II stability/assembly factor-like uncharacterized protein